MPLVDTIEAKGKKIEVFFRPSSAEFFANPEGEEVKAKTYDDVRQKVLAVLNKKKFSIPVTFYRERGDIYGYEAGWNDGVATGVHSGNGNLIVSWGKGKAEQFSRYGITLLRGDVDRDQYLRLRKARDEADKAFNGFVEANKLKVPGWRE